jgi:hypothetical protein
VEEPIEATFELGERIQKNSGYLEKLVISGILGCLFTLILLSGNTIYIITQIRELSRGQISLSSIELLTMALASLLIVTLLAMTVTVILYLSQIHKFYKHLAYRYNLVKDLSGVGEEEPPDVIINKSSGSKGPIEGRHRKNPIFAMLDLVEESMHEFPQLIRLLKICNLFMIFILLFIELNIASRLLIDKSLFYLAGYFELIINAGVLFMLGVTIFLLRGSTQLFGFVQLRHSIIKDIRFGRPNKVPGGKNHLDRLITYLSDSDPFIISSGAIDSGWTKGSAKKEGKSGKTYEFNAYFTSENNLREFSDRMCLPRGKIAIFIKVFDGNITLEALRDYHDAVIDVYQKDNIFPLRIMALQKKIGELEDEPYEYVLENPVGTECCGTHIQITAEDGDTYSFIPQISYGKGVLENK